MLHRRRAYELDLALEPSDRLMLAWQNAEPAPRPRSRSSREESDRFKNNAFDLVVDGESYRSRLKPNIDKLPPPPAAPVKKMPIHPRSKAAARRR